jgi:hypothetical protein
MSVNGRDAISGAGEGGWTYQMGRSGRRFASEEKEEVIAA